jgi:hypothetical protein
LGDPIVVLRAGWDQQISKGQRVSTFLSGGTVRTFPRFLLFATAQRTESWDYVPSGNFATYGRHIFKADPSSLGSSG